MTALAPPRRRPPHACARGSRFPRASITAILVLFALPDPASAQLSGSVAITSDYRLRGHSFSEGRPVASLALNWDSPGGFYLGASGLVVIARGSGPELLGVQESAGFAHRLSPKLTLDLGVLNANYSEYWNGVRPAGYTEAYVGLVGRGISSHIFVSPNYLRSGNMSVYGEVDAVVEPAPLWRLSAHAGLQAQSNYANGAYKHDVQYDWRVAAARRLGPLDLEAALTSGGPGHDPYSRGRYARTAFVVTGTLDF